MRKNATTPFEIRFVSSNRYKAKEASTILQAACVQVVRIDIKLDELQTENIQALLKDKVLKAFQQVGRPLFVEHTGLHLSHLNGLPGGLTQIFWDTLEASRFAQLFGNTADPRAIAKTVVAYTDAKRIFTFEGQIDGRIADEPRGPREFQWDCVFIPSGYDKTFAEMGDQKNDISMRRKALDAFAAFIDQRDRV